MNEPNTEAEPAGPTGRGESANGLVHAVVDTGGRLTELRLDPQLRRLGPRGLVMDSEAMAAEIVKAVNNALDDLQQKIRAEASATGDNLASNLDRIAGDFERSLDQLASDIVRAERRLES
jgi:DNA-binding protein YbaB